MDSDAGILRHYEPTYRMKPYDDKKFQPAAAQRICEDVVNTVLSGKSWNGDEETVWTVSISEQIKSRVKGAGTWDTIDAECLAGASCVYRAELECPRYKYVVQVFLGENKGQGARVASRCLWDTETDNYASFSYKNVRVPTDEWHSSTAKIHGPLSAG